MLQQLDFAQGALGQNLLAKDIGDFLDGNSLVGLVVDGSTVHNRIQVSVRPCSCSALISSLGGRDEG